ncbi:MAG TPA: YkvA family protein [Treponema sp.]|nr:YkvA family protein [Treponema sp.]
MGLKKQLDAAAQWAKCTIGTLYYVSRHPGTPWSAKVVALIALGYALSPIDLIPDFIPLLGYLDDVIILPLLVGLAVRLVPKDIVSACEAEANEHPLSLKKQWGAAVVIVCLWLVLIALILKKVLAAVHG